MAGRLCWWDSNGSVAAGLVGTASGVAVFGAVAGSALRPAHFVTAVHVPAVVCAALWCVAAAVAATTVEGRPTRAACAQPAGA